MRPLIKEDTMTLEPNTKEEKIQQEFQQQTQSNTPNNTI